MIDFYKKLSDETNVELIEIFDKLFQLLKDEKRIHKFYGNEEYYVHLQIENYGVTKAITLNFNFDNF